MYYKYIRMYIYIHIDTLVAHLYAFRGVVKIQFPCVCVCVHVCVCVCVCDLFHAGSASAETVCMLVW